MSLNFYLLKLLTKICYKQEAYLNKYLDVFLKEIDFCLFTDLLEGFNSMFILCFNKMQQIFMDHKLCARQSTKSWGHT